VGVLKAVDPTVSGSFKSSGPYCEWDFLKARLRYFYRSLFVRIKKEKK